jgi:hypothetical protein
MQPPFVDWPSTPLPPMIAVCTTVCVQYCSVLQSAHGAAQRTGAAGSASVGDPANPRGGEQNLGDIDLVRCWPTERMEGERERAKKKSGVGDLTLSVSDSNRQ